MDRCVPDISSISNGVDSNTVPPGPFGASDHLDHELLDSVSRYSTYLQVIDDWELADRSI